MMCKMRVTLTNKNEVDFSFKIDGDVCASNEEDAHDFMKSILKEFVAEDVLIKTESISD